MIRSHVFVSLALLGATSATFTAGRADRDDPDWDPGESQFLLKETAAPAGRFGRSPGGRFTMRR
jgi:hypothetical protein